MIFSKKQHEAFHLYLLMLFCFFLPIVPQIAVLFIILTGINWLLSNSFFLNFDLLLKPLSVLFLSFYLLHLVGLTYTSDLAIGLAKAETKLPLLVFPLLLFSFPLKKENHFRYILYGFVAGSFVASAYSFLHAFYKFSQTGSNWFFYKQLSSFLNFHPTYFSMYLSFAFFLVLFSLMKNFKNFSRKNKNWHIALLSWFFLVILLLASRMTILATVSILAIAFLGFMFLKKKMLYGLGIAGIALIFLSFVALNLPGLKKRADKTLERIENQQMNQGVSDPRINIWKASLTIVKKNPVYGTGLGDTQNDLTKIYKEFNYTQPLEGNFNTHNQYLQTTISLGIIGGLLLLLTLLVPLYLAFRQKDVLYLFFLSLVLLSFLTESVLETERGTLFYGFFSTFMAIYFLHKKSNVNESKPE